MRSQGTEAHHRNGGRCYLPQLNVLLFSFFLRHWVVMGDWLVRCDELSLEIKTRKELGWVAEAPEGNHESW